MEKRHYEWNYFFEEVAPSLSLIADCFEAEVYKSGDEIWKIFHCYFCNRNEENMEKLALLNKEYLTTPRALFYLSDEYFGYAMEDAGIDLSKMILNGNLTRNDLLAILQQLKERIFYLHSLSLGHGDIKFENILVKNGHVRLGDINSLTYPAAVPNLNRYYQEWYKKWNDYFLVDIFAFNYLTFLLLNYPISMLQAYIKGNGVESKRALKELTSFPNNIVDSEIWSYVRGLLNLHNPESKKPYLKPNMLLLDYLK